MFSTSTKLLIIILALLQLLAPLVHAHTIEEYSEQKIHLPGLEHLNSNYGSSASHSIIQPHNHQCSVISVGTGIKHNNAFSDKIDSINFALENILSKTIFSPTRITVFQQPSRIAAIPYFLLPSRAPPSSHKS